MTLTASPGIRGTNTLSSDNLALKGATADATNPANFFRTGSGSVTVSQDGNVISPQSEQGRELQAIYDRQQAQKNVNVEQKKLLVNNPYPLFITIYSIRGFVIKATFEKPDPDNSPSTFITRP